MSFLLRAASFLRILAKISRYYGGVGGVGGDGGRTAGLFGGIGGLFGRGNVRTTYRYRRHRFWSITYLGEGLGDGNIVRRTLRVSRTLAGVRQAHQQALAQGQRRGLRTSRNNGIQVRVVNRGIKRARGSRR